MPPSVDQLYAPKPVARVLAHFDFEKASDPGLRLHNDGSVLVRRVTDSALVIDGRGSLLCDTRTAESEWSTLLTTTSRVRIPADTPVQVRVSYRVVDPGRRYRAPFATALRTPSAGIAHDVGDRRTWGGSPGFTGERVMYATTESFDDYYLFLSIHGRAALIVDDIAIEVVRID